jgi:hypothetical protein
MSMVTGNVWRDGPSRIVLYLQSPVVPGPESDWITTDLAGSSSLDPLLANVRCMYLQPAVVTSAAKTKSNYRSVGRHIIPNTQTKAPWEEVFVRYMCVCLCLCVANSGSWPTIMLFTMAACAQECKDLRRNGTGPWDYYNVEDKRTLRRCTCSLKDQSWSSEHFTFPGVYTESSGCQGKRWLDLRDVIYIYVIINFLLLVQQWSLQCARAEAVRP